jgi:hypothetical protein
MAEDKVKEIVAQEAFGLAKIYLVLIGVAGAAVPIVTALVSPFI